MSNVPANLRYRESHEWIDPTQTPSPCGITDHAQAELTDVVFAELPKVGRIVKAGEQVAVIESVKAASDIYAPVAGEIVAVNEALTSNPALLNTDPYVEGWMFKIQPTDSAAAASLLSAEGYTALIG